MNTDDGAEPDAEPDADPDAAATDDGPRTTELELGRGVGLTLGTCTGITDEGGAGTGVDEHWLQCVTVEVTRGRERLYVWPAEVVN